MNTRDFLKSMFFRPGEIHNDAPKIVKYAIIFSALTVTSYILADIFFNKWLLVDLQSGYFREHGIFFNLLVEEPITIVIERTFIAVGIFLFLRFFHKLETYSFTRIFFIVFLYSIIELFLFPFYLIVLNVKAISYSIYEQLSIVTALIILCLLIFLPMLTFSIKSFLKRVSFFFFVFVFTIGCIVIMDFAIENVLKR